MPVLENGKTKRRRGRFGADCKIWTLSPASHRCNRCAPHADVMLSMSDASWWPSVLPPALDRRDI